jgi:D-glycero-D-manno-heptose 1,7-bisphosphate phosphatase
MPTEAEPARAAVFLDRDGTIIVERHYLAVPEQVQLVPGAATALATLAAAGFVLIVVTNQSGIARGLYTEEDFQAVQQRLDQLLRAEGVTLAAVYHCPHHPDFSGPCDCRKPGSGMFRRAQQELRVDLSRSVYVGDRGKDVVPALEFGGLGILVETGYGAEEAATVPEAVRVAKDLAAAAEMILVSQVERDQRNPR